MAFSRLSLARRIWPYLCSERAEKGDHHEDPIRKNRVGTEETHPGRGGPCGHISRHCHKKDNRTPRKDCNIGGEDDTEPTPL